MDKKSDAYYKYQAEKEKGQFSYYESDEIEQIVYDLLDDCHMLESLFVLDNIGLKLHPGDSMLLKIKALIYIHIGRVEDARALYLPFKDDNTFASEMLRVAFEIVDGRWRSALKGEIVKLKRKQLRSIDFVNIVDEVWDLLPRDWFDDYLIQASKVINDDAEALARLAAMLMDLGQKKYAIPVLEHSLDIDAYDIYSWQDLARCCFELEDYGKCEEACDLGLAIDETNPVLHFMRGNIRMLVNKDYAGAVEDLVFCRDYAEGTLKHEDLNIPMGEKETQVSLAYELLGQCYTNLDKADDAIKCYLKVVERNPKKHDAFLCLTQLYLDKGNLPEALAMIDKAILLSRRNTTYLSLKVSILASMHRFDEAIEVLDKLIILKPKSKNFILAKAELALGIHKFELADTEFRKLLLMAPHDSSTITLMKEYFESIGDIEALKIINNF